MLVSFIKEYPFFLAFLLGLIPALIWLWFWLKEDSHPEPAKMITLSFLGGILAVLIALPLEKMVFNYFKDAYGLSMSIPFKIFSLETVLFAIWASIEEISKLALVYFIALKRKVTDEPIDDVMYLIVAALGFVTLENALFLREPLSNGDVIGAIVNGNLRFVGSSLLHVMSSATIGASMAMSFYRNNRIKKEHLLSGVILAIILHTIFNLFIINESHGNVFLTFGMVWIGIVVLLLLFEKIKHTRRLTKAQ